MRRSNAPIRLRAALGLARGPLNDVSNLEPAFGVLHNATAMPTRWRRQRLAGSTALHPRRLRRIESAEALVAAVALD